MTHIFHVHTYRCQHADNVADEEYVKAALETGAEKITFTDHAPFPGEPFQNRMKMSELEEYLDSINSLKTKYEGQIEVVSGLEIEYLPSFKSYYEDLRGNKKISVMMIGQHFFEKSPDVYSFSDAPEEKKRTEAEGCGKAIIQGMESGLFDVVAHPDGIFRRKKDWDSEMENLSLKIIKTAQKTNIMLENNLTSRLVKGKLFYRPEFWKLCEKQGNCKTITGLDAHSPAFINEVRNEFLIPGLSPADFLRLL